MDSSRRIWISFINEIAVFQYLAIRKRPSQKFLWNLFLDQFSSRPCAFVSIYIALKYKKLLDISQKLNLYTVDLLLKKSGMKNENLFAISWKFVDFFSKIPETM